MKFIDTHSHLFMRMILMEDRDEVVQKAIDSGVEKILLPNISSKYTKMLSLCQNYPNNCFPMMGLHLCDVNLDNYEEEIEHVKKELLMKNILQSEKLE